MTSQLFESSSLEEALAEVRDTVGPHARIVRAEKVRRGGIGGFFSKETFVLSVEQGEPAEPDVRVIAGPPVVAARPTAPPTAYSLAELADAADSYESSDRYEPSAYEPVGPPLTADQQGISTESSMFDRVLRDVTRATAADPELPAGPRWDGTLVDLDETYRSIRPQLVTPAPPEGPRAPAPITPPAPARQAWWKVLAEVAEAEREANVTIDLQAAPGSERSYPPPAPLLPAPLPPAPLPPAPLLGGDAIADLLAEQPSILPTTEVPTTINAALGPALLPGSVIAVVGHPDDAGTVAAWVAVAAAADPFSLHFASPDEEARLESGLPTGRQIGSAEEATLRSRRFPSRPTPVVVVIDGRDARWARTVLDAIEATTVVALPSPQDDDVAVRRWVAGLGGVQALLVDESCRTTPESLALHGIPALRSPWSLSVGGGGTR